MANTKQPCPGCGKVYSHRAVKELCSWCQQALKLGREIQETMKQPPAGMEKVRVPNVNNWPYIHYQGGFHNKPGDRIQDHLHDLVKLLGKTDGQSWYSEKLPDLVEIPRTGSQVYTTDWLLPAGFREIIHNLYKDIHALAENCYLHGRAQGESFVGRMAAGELSASEISEHDEKMAKAMQQKRDDNYTVEG